MCQGTSRSVSYTHLDVYKRQDKDRFITVDFKCNHKGKIRTLPTEAKTLRGEMSRYIVKNKIKSSKELKDFTYEGYKYSSERSGKDKYVFLKI